KDLKAIRLLKFVCDTVRKARYSHPNLDQLVDIVVACQSHFELLIKAGANIARLLARINMHGLDACYISAKIAYTSFMEKVSVWDVLRNTLTGEKGMGGVETRGLLRTGMPLIEDD